MNSQELLQEIFYTASGQLLVKKHNEKCGKVKDIGGYYLHLFLTAISIIMNISQILYLLPPGSSSSEIFTDIDRILNSKGWVPANDGPCNMDIGDNSDKSRH